MFDFEKCMRQGIEQYKALEREFDETIRALRARTAAAELDASSETPFSHTQGTMLTARDTFTLRTRAGLTVVVRQGDQFQVTSSSAMQAERGLVWVARLKEAPPSRYGFKPEDIGRCFRVDGVSQP